MMNWRPTISEHHLLKGIEDIRGTAVVFDVYRACTTMAALLTSGVEKIVLVPDSDDARALRAANPGWLFFGEEGGVKLEDADGDNSPTNALQGNYADKTVLLRTSSGVPCVKKALTQVDEVLCGTIATAPTVLAYIADQEPEYVSLIACGDHGTSPAREDELVLEYFQSALRGESMDMDAFMKDLMEHETSGAHRLRRLGLDDDLKLCSTIDALHVVPIARMEDGMIVVRQA